MVKYVGNAYAEDVGIEAFGYVHGGVHPPGCVCAATGFPWIPCTFNA